MPDRDRTNSRNQKPAAATGGWRRRGVLVPGLVALVAAAVLVATLVNGDGDAPATEASGAASRESAGESRGKTRSESPDRSSRAPDDTWEQLVRRDPDDPTARGDVEAPVVMLAYSEFQCPYCGSFARETAPTLIKEYVKKGLLRIEWRDFPYLGEESMTAAYAARAAGLQGRFWEFHDELYADQAPPNSGKLTEDYLAGIAEDLGLDVDRFRSDMSSQEVKDAVQVDFSEGQQIGVTGTPAFVVDGVPVIGAQPLEVFRATIDEALEASR